MSIEQFSVRGRLADTGEGITGDELQLAARNHGIPLEGLRYDVTPPGLHYVLVHYDIPATNAATWSLTIDGCVEQPLSFGLTELRAMGRRTVRVTLECAGNGRAALQPRPISQPWLNEAVGTAEWTGVLLSDLLRAAGIREDAVDVVFTGADHGVERGVEQDYQRGLSVTEAIDSGAIVAWEMNGQPLPPQHGYPLRLVVPGWYGMASVKWLRSIELIDHEFDGYQNARSRTSPVSR
jgi:DMSO/TMAO reductase YedYZ molybdopterin-dependent catalytic subunit